MDAPLWVNAGQTCSVQRAGRLHARHRAGGGFRDSPGTVLPSQSPFHCPSPLLTARPALGPPLHLRATVGQRELMLLRDCLGPGLVPGSSQV